MDLPGQYFLIFCCLKRNKQERKTILYRFSLEAKATKKYINILHCLLISLKIFSISLTLTLASYMLVSVVCGAKQEKEA